MNIKQAYNEQEKIMHEKMQAEVHLQDREAMNKKLEEKVFSVFKANWILTDDLRDSRWKQKSKRVKRPVTIL